MADTASLIVRVKAEGAEQAADQLDDLSAASAMAEGQAAAYARAQAKAAAETKKSVPAVKGLSDITEQLGNKIAVLREAQENGARSAAILAAQLKAGANASSEEISRIGELTGKLYDLSNGQEKINTSTKAANDGLGRFRNTAGQVGYQVQDMVVQLQGGTSAFVAIGQQGSQLAGAFGPGGAVLGAVIALASAVGGVLYKAFTDTGASAKDLEKGANELAKSFQTTKTGTIEFSDALIQLSQNGDAAYGSMVKLIGLQASQQVYRSTTAIKEQAKELLGNSVAAQTSISTLDELISRNVDVASTLDNINVVTDAGSAKYGNLAASVREVAETYGISTKEVTDMLVAQRQFNAEPTAENAQKIADATARAATAATENKKEILDQAEAAQTNALELKKAREQQDLVTESQKRMGAATNSTTKKINEQNDAIVRSAQIAILGERERVKAMADADKEAFSKREGATAEQIAAYNAAKDKEAQQDIARINATEQKKTDAVAKQADNRAEAQAKRDANAAAAQKKAAETFIATIDRQSGDEIARINTTEQQKLDALDEFQKQGALKAGQYEATKTKIQLDAETARQEELTKRKEEQAKKEDKQDAFIAQIMGQNATELELLDIQQKQKEAAAAAFRDGTLDQEEKFQQAKEAIAQQYDKKRVSAYSNMLGQTTDDLKTALGEGNAMYKAFAIANAIMQTYVAANAAYQSAAAIPIVGWIAGPIAAAAAVAAGLANVGKIRSAREQGGNLSSGQASTIAERNKAEVIVPASASRVRTAQQMRQIMGENSSSSSANNGVVIVNNTTGRVDSATTERDDEGRLRVIIDEHVSSAMQDSNSNISKSRRATRGLPGF